MGIVIRKVWLVSAFIAVVSTSGAWAAEPFALPPLQEPTVTALDSNHVDLSSGKISLPSPSISIGAGGSQLTVSQSGLNAMGVGTFAGGINPAAGYLCAASVTEGNHCAYDYSSSYPVSYASITYPGGTQDFVYQNGEYTSVSGSGDQLRYAYPLYILTAKDGTRYIFDNSVRSDRGDVMGSVAVLTRIERPDGEVIKIEVSIGYGESFGYGDQLHFSLIDSVYSSHGYRLQSDSQYFADHSGQDNGSTAQRRMRHTVAFNMAVYNCTAARCDPNAIPFPKTYYKMTAGGTVEGTAITEDLGWYTKFTYPTTMTPQFEFYHEGEGGAAPKYYGQRTDFFQGNRAEVFDYDEPMYPAYYYSNSKSISADFAYFNDGGGYAFGALVGEGCSGGASVPINIGGYHTRVDTCVSQVVRGGQTWTYAYQAIGETMKVTVTNPDSSTREVVSKVVAGPKSVVMSIKDELGRIMSFERDTYGRVTKQTLPDGQYTTYNYDDRANITHNRQFAANNTAGPVREASYPATCDNTNYRICNRPVWVEDAKDNRTDYTYDAAHGGVLTETGPADSSGVRPQTRYTYTAYYAQAKNSSGNLVSIGTLFPYDPAMAAPIYKLTKVSTCRVATSGNPASCVGTAAEQVKEFAYADNNLLLTSETVRNGDSSVSATTSYTYDTRGNVISVNGPRTDVDDTSHTTYDVLRRKVFEIGPDPDGGGALLRPMVKHYYDGGNEVRTESGYGSGTDGTGFVWKTARKMTYGNLGMLLKTEVVVP